MGDPTSSKNHSEDRPVQRFEVSKRIQKASKADDDSFILFRKKFHFPNTLVMKVPARSDRACFLPPGYVTVYEFSLQAGLRFPPASELIDILTIYGVCLSQFSYRVMSIVMSLIILFRDCGVGISLATRRDAFLLGPSGWIFALETHRKNDWNFQEKWGKLKELPIPLHIGAKDLLRILKLPDLDALHYEMRYLSRYIDEEVSEVVPQKCHSKRPGSEEGLQAPRKKKADEILAVVSKGPRVSPSKSYIPEDVLNHQCIGRRRAEELLEQHSDFKLEITKTLNDWNNEFVKVKYLQGEYKRKYDSKVKEMKVVEDQLAGYRAELANKITSAYSQSEWMDHLHIELQSVLSEKKAQQLPSIVIEEFKKSYAFKIIIEDNIQEARNHIYDVEVKALEAECIEDGFIRGFIKGVRAVHRKTGAEIERLTPS
ncbi:hypothetical protein IEQ34_007358 [Dendrobium chrysotoxum]|uniref:Uncharacterized protein n=1 Tax=Dendrobium chrysotoxum TaxID=161865 RepID=A0AAV7H800_DENCH|nr:hypothetical protein IEQ34_007358 [Dendrobium chrysotoxum]